MLLTPLLNDGGSPAEPFQLMLETRHLGEEGSNTSVTGAPYVDVATLSRGHAAALAQRASVGFVVCRDELDAGDILAALTVSDTLGIKVVCREGYAFGNVAEGCPRLADFVDALSQVPLMDGVVAGASGAGRARL